MKESVYSFLIDIHTEACFLTEDKSITTPLGEYGSLPWLEKNEKGQYYDVNFDNAYLGEEILFPPFQNESMILRKGVHLHWIAPPFLGTAHAKTLPSIPNRWLIKRYDSEKKLAREWLVISDYVHEATINDNEEIELTNDYSIFPIPLSVKKEEGSPPFCYVGKAFEKDQVPNDLKAKSFKQTFNQDLTVLGFGNAQFSACYPNCKSVFGFHDKDGQIGNIYTITGWHAEEENDLVINEIKTHFKTEKISNEALKKLLRKKFNLEIDCNNTPLLSIGGFSQTIYVTQITIDRQAAQKNATDLKVAVGNTPTEAFSALVAHKIHPNDALEKVKVEDQLEYFLLNANMNGQLIDHIPKFLEARHRKGFYMHKGGSIYTFQNQIIGQTKGFKGYGLSDQLYEALNQLNSQKHQLNEAENELESLKKQLYTDWYKYMRTAYPPIGFKDEFLDRDQLEDFIQYNAFIEISDKKAAIQKLKVATQNSISHSKDSILNLYKRLLNKKIVQHREKVDNLSDDALTKDINQQKRSIASLNQNLKEAYTTEERLILSNKIKAKEKIVNNYEQHFQIITQLKKELSKADSSDTIFPLKDNPEQPFWEPSEPVIALDGFKFGKRAAPKNCKLKTISFENGFPIVPKESFSYPLKLSELEWCPFYMEWEVSLDDQTLNIHNKNSFFENLYLDNDSPGIYQKTLQENDNDAYFQGGSILNPFISDSFMEGMQRYINYSITKLSQLSKKEDEDQNEKAFWGAKKDLAAKALQKIAIAPKLSTFCVSIVTKLKEEQKGLKGKKATIVANQLAFWDSFKDDSSDGHDILCQKLAGFNTACLMLRQVPQLEMKEPLGFDSSILFTNEVAKNCDARIKLSPAPLYEFQPIRNGRLRLRKLRFIDNFGMYQDLSNFESIITSDSLTSQELRKADNLKEFKEKDKVNKMLKEVFLPPRLVQASRLNFHFLEGHQLRMTENPNTNPVYGWLIPNFLDETILVFDTNGKALGTIEKVNGFVKLPWENSLPTLDPYFKKVLDKIVTSSDSFTDDFLTAIQGAQSNIAPEKFSLQNAKVLLMGNPIAVTRIQIDLQIKGYPALDQSWQATFLDTQKAARLNEDKILGLTNRFSGKWNQMELPLRLGEYKQLNDGLIGYWMEDETGLLSKAFYAPQTNVDSSEYIVSNSEVNITDNQANPYIHKIEADGAPLSFTVLMDPRGIVHATTGVLPTESIAIPSEFYQLALEKMYMWFETGPILQYAKDKTKESDKTLSLNLPTIPDYEWKWFESKEKGKIDIDKPVFDQLYEHLPELKEGYLMLTPIKKETTKK